MNDGKDIYSTPAMSGGHTNSINSGVSPSPRMPRNNNVHSFDGFPFPTPPPNFGQERDVGVNQQEWDSYKPDVIRTEMNKRLSSVTAQFKTELEKIKNQNRDL
jgi:hypothetical protein